MALTLGLRRYVSKSGDFLLVPSKVGHGILPRALAVSNLDVFARADILGDLGRPVLLGELEDCSLIEGIWK